MSKKTFLFNIFWAAFAIYLQKLSYEISSWLVGLKIDIFSSVVGI